VIDIGRRSGGRGASGNGPPTRWRVVERLVMKAIGSKIGVIGIDTLIGVIEGNGWVCDDGAKQMLLSKA